MTHSEDDGRGQANEAARVESGSTSTPLALYGVVAELKTPAALVAAARKVREAGYRRWDAFSPFPVHGMERAMGVRMTRLPFLVLLGGLVGLASAFVMQWWMNGIDYPINVAGKPLLPLPANIPVMFELTVLVAGVTAFLSVLVLNLLPEPHHPLFALDRFKRVSDDTFFIAVEATDKHFDETETVELLVAAGAAVVENVHGRTGKSPLPRAIVYGAVIFVVLSLVPFALVARARLMTSTEPRLHLVFDMDAQPKMKAQSAAPFFANDRAYRPPIAGTQVHAAPLDEHLLHGSVDGKFVDELPRSVEVSDASMRRGRERFNIYCSPCHAQIGDGNGMVARRADELKEGTWIPPASMHAPNVRAQPLGQLVHTMENGIRNMPAYGAQIPAADRWDTAMYIRALELSQAASIDAVPPEARPGLR